MKNLNERIKYILERMDGKDRGKQARLASIAGCTRGLVTQWLTVEGQSIGYEYAKNIHDAFGYPIDWIISGANEPPTHTLDLDDREYNLIMLYRKSNDLGRSVIDTVVNGSASMLLSGNDSAKS